ncbi:MAG: GAF domain-containing protein [Candidatus Omnitrophica bacterium]|nr:GAF domain-containing protein [Candidatus Omnitrophota bacterium]
MNTNDFSNLTKKYKQIISAVHIVYRLVNSTPNLKELSLRLTRLLCQFVKASSASIYLLAPDRQRLSTIAAFNNEINMLVVNPRELKKASAKDMDVTRGNSVFEPRMMGMPLVTDECIGAIVIRRKLSEPVFDDYDREMFTIFAEQSVTAIRNLQYSEQQQKILLETMRLVRSLFNKQGDRYRSHSSVYFKIVRCIAQKFRMGTENINNLYYASVLHNAGAVDIPYQVLAKKSQLTPQEFKLLRDLPKKSVDLIKPIEFLKPVLPVVLYLHEKYDGTGYPSGLKREQIPLGARIMAVVDAFESMVQGRPYRKRLTVDGALREIREHSGTQFDPSVVDAFMRLSLQKNFRNYLCAVRE